MAFRASNWALYCFSNAEAVVCSTVAVVWSTGVTAGGVTVIAGGAAAASSSRRVILSRSSRLSFFKAEFSSAILVEREK